MPQPIIPISMLGRGMYFDRNSEVAGSIRFDGITLPGNGSRMICGLEGLTGLVESNEGLAWALNGLNMDAPLMLKSPMISSSVGTVAIIVSAFVCRRPS